MSDPPHSVNRFSPGSLGELWLVFYPLLIASVCNYFVIIVERIIIGKHSFVAMKAVGLFSVVYFLLYNSLLSFSLKTNVVIGQFFGAKDYENMGRAPWQMLWLSSATYLLWIPFVWLAVPLILPSEYHSVALTYAQLIILSVPISGATFALACFYIGQGKSNVIFSILLLGNIINIILDLILVLGIPGVFPSMGATGAALATLIAFSTQLLIILALFLTPHNQSPFFTHHCRFNRTLFLQVYKYAWPSAVAYFFGFLSFSLYYYIIHLYDAYYFGAFLIAHSLYVLAFSTVEPLATSVQILASNYIGSKHLEAIPRIMGSAFFIALCILILLSIPFIFFPETSVSFFMLDERYFTLAKTTYIKKIAAFGISVIWFGFFFDCLFYSLHYFLNCSGDRIFSMFANVIINWLCLPVSLAIAYFYFEAHAWVAFFLPVVNYVLCFSVCFLRFRSKAWMRFINLTHP